MTRTKPSYMRFKVEDDLRCGFKGSDFSDSQTRRTLTPYHYQHTTQPDTTRSTTRMDQPAPSPLNAQLRDHAAEAELGLLAVRRPSTSTSCTSEACLFTKRDIINE